MFRQFWKLGHGNPSAFCSGEDKRLNVACPHPQGLRHRGLSPRARLARWGFLGFASAPIWGAYAYNREYHLPFGRCLLRDLTGIPCPTCGMTRSFMAVARGDLGQAIDYHLFGPALFLLLLVAVLHLSCELASNRPIATFYSRALLNSRLQLLLIASFLGYYGIRLEGLLQSGKLANAPLLSAFSHLPLILQSS